MTKYGNKSSEFAGRSFSSQGERDCFQMLQLMERAKEIKILQCQDHIYLTEARILYVPDFKIRDLKLERDVWVEYKGFETSDWMIKKRLWAFYGPGPLRVYKGKGLRMTMVEEIRP